MKHLVPLFLLTLLAAANAGCRHEGAVACDEFVDVYATRLVECGAYATYDDAEAAIIANISAGTPARVENCDDIWGLRDRVSFHDDCIPGIRALECSAPSLPPACVDQLLYE